MLTLPDQRGFVQCDSEDLPTSGVNTTALTIVKANEKFVADLIVVKEYNSCGADCGFTALFTSFGAYTMRGFGKRTFKDRPVNCGKSALRLAYYVGVFHTMFGCGQLMTAFFTFHEDMACSQAASECSTASFCCSSQEGT